MNLTDLSESTNWITPSTPFFLLPRFNSKCRIFHSARQHRLRICPFSRPRFLLFAKRQMRMKCLSSLFLFVTIILLPSFHEQLDLFSTRTLWIRYLFPHPHSNPIKFKTYFGRTWYRDYWGMILRLLYLHSQRYVFVATSKSGYPYKNLTHPWVALDRIR